MTIVTDEVAGGVHNLTTMSYSDIGTFRLRAHLESLRLQEEDARHELEQPNLRPWIQEQLQRLIARLGEERRLIETALLEADEPGRAAS